MQEVYTRGEMDPTTVLVHLRRLRALLHDEGVVRGDALTDVVAGRNNYKWADIVELVDAIKHGCVWMKICQPVHENHPAARFITRVSGQRRVCIHEKARGECDDCVFLTDKGVDSLLLTRTGTTKTVQTKNYAAGVCRVYAGMSTFVMTSTLLRAEKTVFSLSEGATLCKDSAGAAAISNVEVAALANAEIVEICTRALALDNPHVDAGVIDVNDIIESSSDSDSTDDSEESDDGSDDGSDDSSDYSNGFSDDATADSTDGSSDVDSTTDESSDTESSDESTTDDESEESSDTGAFTDGSSTDDDEDDPADNRFVLRAMQSEMHDELTAGEFCGRYRFQLPCGAGKTSYVCWLCSEMRAREPSARFAFLVPTKALADRTTPAFTRWGLTTCVVHSDAAHTPKQISSANVVICVYNSVEVISGGHFRGVFTDEAHHIENVYATDTWRKTCRRVAKNAQLRVELSATFYNPAACTLSFDYEDAVAEKICSDIALVIPMYTGKGDRMVALAEHIRDGSSVYRKILAFCNSVANARKFARTVADCIPKMTVFTVDASTHTRRRQKILDTMAAGDGRVMIVSVQTLCEGIDIPIADTCVFVDPRHSSIKLWQPIGRVARAIPGVKTLAHVILPMSDDMKILRKFTTELSKRMPQVRHAIESGCGNSSVIEIATVGDTTLPTEKISTMQMSLVTALRGDWWQKAELLEEYARTNLKMPAAGETYRGESVGGWVCTQRKGITKGTIDEGRLARLRAIPHWSDDAHADTWERMYAALLAYTTEHEKMPQRGETYRGESVRGWVYTQRRAITKGTITEDRLARLRAIPQWK